MASSSPENVDSGRKKLIEQLVHGRDIANQLQTLLSHSVADDGSVVDSAEDLVSKIMLSFTNTLSMLNQNDNDEAVVSQIQVQSAAAAAASSHVENKSPCLDGRKSEDSGESCRSVSTAITRIDRRGSYKRRCSHKYEQECQATKQVQKMQDNPPVYKTTYFGHHTCTNLLKSPKLVLDCPTSTPGHDSCMLFSFNNSHLNLKSKQAAHPFFPSFSSVKPESVNDDPTLQPCINNVNNDNNNNNVVSHNQTSSPDYVVSSPDALDHDHPPAFHHSPVWSSNFDSDIHGNVMSFDDDLFPHMNF
ncbi:hypothetical protein TIFTF001_009854 [Ficus carica]|uniref:WRKY domain-containing protein n=1 Tax=Ficus carica TaxID=3494 RepID=A0AA88DHK4_FICCA|nr:hypothetical protein TIFTF001_009854 [Ficus carica]